MSNAIQIKKRKGALVATHDVANFPKFAEAELGTWQSKNRTKETEEGGRRKRKKQ
jgi:hypothetical protein